MTSIEIECVWSMDIESLAGQCCDQLDHEEILDLIRVIDRQCADEDFTLALADWAAGAAKRVRADRLRDDLDHKLVRVAP